MGAVGMKGIVSRTAQRGARSGGLMPYCPACLDRWWSNRYAGRFGGVARTLHPACRKALEACAAE